MNSIKGFSKKPQVSEEQLLEVKEAFNVFDSEQTGGLDARELKAAITALNIKISKDEIRNIYQELGKDIREKITLEEFMDIVIPRLPDWHSKEYIQKIFQYFDLENTGKITATLDKKVLLIDADPQANATSGLGIDHTKVDTTVYDCLIGSATATEAIIPTCVDRLDVISSRIDLVGAE